MYNSFFTICGGFSSSKEMQAFWFSKDSLMNAGWNAEKKESKEKK